jgi:hypothetical protein
MNCTVLFVHLLQLKNGDFTLRIGYFANNPKKQGGSNGEVERPLHDFPLYVEDSVSLSVIYPGAFRGRW